PISTLNLPSKSTNHAMQARNRHYLKPRFTGNGKSGFWRITEKPERRRYSGKRYLHQKHWCLPRI
ncbi:hypothetical protein, partial [Escherichia coli]|uniref:hypothetical protein n=1 Tax=Escherichia coli TaxID=562 RepID=UPI00207B29E1